MSTIVGKKITELSVLPSDVEAGDIFVVQRGLTTYYGTEEQVRNGIVYATTNRVARVGSTPNVLEPSIITDTGVLIGIDETNPQAIVDIKASDGTYPSIRLQGGTLTGTPVVGGMEFDGTDLYFTGGDSVRNKFLYERIVTEAQRLAISSPYEGLFVYDTDFNDAFFYSGNSWIPAGARNAHVQKDELPTGETLYVGADEQVFVFGNYTVNGTLDVQPGGSFNIINGNDREVAIYNADGILDNSVVKIEANGVVNVPVFASAPVSLNNGDFFFTNNGGVTLLNYRVGGMTKSVELTL